MSTTSSPRTQVNAQRLCWRPQARRTAVKVVWLLTVSVVTCEWPRVRCAWIQAG